MRYAALTHPTQESGFIKSTILRGKPVDRATFVELCDKLSLDCQEIAESIQAPPMMGEERQPSSSLVPLQRWQDWGETTISWGEAVDVSAFYGREVELSLLKQWVVDDRCRLLTQEKLF